MPSILTSLTRGQCFSSVMAIGLKKTSNTYFLFSFYGLQCDREFVQLYAGIGLFSAEQKRKEPTDSSGRVSFLKLVFSTKKSGVNIEKEIKSSIACMWLCPKALSQITITTDFHLRSLPNECHCPQFKLIGPLTLATYGESNFISFLIYSKAHRCFGKELKMISGIRIGSSRAYLSRFRTINNRTNKPK